MDEKAPVGADMLMISTLLLSIFISILIVFSVAGDHIMLQPEAV